MNIFKKIESDLREDLESLVAEGKLAQGLDFGL